MFENVFTNELGILKTISYAIETQDSKVSVSELQNMCLRQLIGKQLHHFFIFANRSVLLLQTCVFKTIKLLPVNILSEAIKILLFFVFSKQFGDLLIHKIILKKLKNVN